MNLKQVGSNQMELSVNQHLVLISYETPVAYLYNGHAYITEKFWSRTTSKHIGLFLTRHGFPKDGIKIPQEKLDNLLNEVRS